MPEGRRMHGKAAASHGRGDSRASEKAASVYTWGPRGSLERRGGFLSAHQGTGQTQGDFVNGAGQSYTMAVCPSGMHTRRPAKLVCRASARIPGALPTDGRWRPNALLDRAGERVAGVGVTGLVAGAEPVDALLR
jgi:hypothetical protein